MVVADAMNNLQMWDLIVGFFLPAVLAFIVQHHWSDQIRAVLAFLASLVAAIGTVLIQQGGWDWDEWIGSSLLILVTAITTYKGFWIKAHPAFHNRGATNDAPHRSDR